MMLLPMLALMVATTSMPKAADLIKAPEPEAVTVVYVGCSIRQTVLSDCKVVNQNPVEPGAAAMALKLASGMSVSQALADKLGGHIVVKLNVK